MIKQYELRPLNTNGKVYLGIPRERVYIPAFVDNRDQILMALQKLGRTCGYFQTEGHRVDRNRDRICQEFLNSSDKPDWLLMLDSDMDHPRDIAERLTRWGKPIVGGLYFHRGESHDPFVFTEAPLAKDEYGRMAKLWKPMRDEVFNFLRDNDVPMMDGALAIDDCVGSPLVECDAVATGAMAIHRSVLETMKQPWWEYRELGNSEDMIFCYEAKHDYGIPIYCDFSTISGHYIFSPQGQAQFRQVYEKRGLNLSGYTKREAAELLAEYLGMPIEHAVEKIESGNAHMAGDYWLAKFKDKEPTQKEIDEFYKDPYTGQLYLVELLHWNYSRVFYNIKSLYLGIRNKRVLEIGSGIGTLALQLSVQKNKVTAVEPNKVLRDFAKLRYKKLQEEITTEVGEITFVPGEWKLEDGELFDVVVSTDTFEHIPAVELKEMVKRISASLKIGGDMIYHANFEQQDLYPMHFNHSDIWDAMLIEAGFMPLSHTHARKVK